MDGRSRPLAVALVGGLAVALLAVGAWALWASPGPEPVHLGGDAAQGSGSSGQAGLGDRPDPGVGAAPGTGSTGGVEAPARPSSYGGVALLPLPDEPPQEDAPYDGPADAVSVLQACEGNDERLLCVLGHLMNLLTARGSEAAFTALEEAAGMDSRINTASHPLAHVMGGHALDVYGGIQNALATCSYRAFQGCFHGALQSFFDRTEFVDRGLVTDLCRSNNTFRLYACTHGLGHGVMLLTHYSLKGSLHLCDSLDTDYGRQSCYGGVFMENVVAWIDRQNPTAVSNAIPGHQHDHDTFVRPEDPAYPCNIVDSAHQSACWLMQTSLILRLNGGDFQGVADTCGELEFLNRWSCFHSMGRDASAWSLREPAAASRTCGLTPDEAARRWCVRGFVIEVILNSVDPVEGIRVCWRVEDVDKHACYDVTGAQGRGMVGSERMAEVCDRSEQEHRAACRRGAGLPVADDDVSPT